MICLSPGSLLAQWSKSFITNTHTFSLAGINTTLAGINGIGGNPASLTSAKSPAIQLSTTNLYSLPELFYYHVSVLLPSEHHYFGLQAGRFGDPEQSDMHLSFLYARKLGKTISLGVGLNLLQFRIREYGQRLTFAIDGGVQWDISERIKIGYSLFAHRPVDFNLANELSFVQKVGAAYAPTNFLSIYTQLDWTDVFGWQIHGGVAYEVHPSISFTFGARNNPFISGMGISIKVFNNLAIQMATQFHQSLGLSPSIGITWNLND